MIGHKADWDGVCEKHGFTCSAELFRNYRKEAKMPWSSIALKVGLSTSAVWNHAMYLVETGDLTREDIQR